MALKALRDGASGGMLKFFLMGFMALAVGGLVMTDVGGFFRGGVGSSDAAKVGGESISVMQFDRKVRQASQQLGINSAQAYQFGYINQLLNVEIRNKLLEQAAGNVGLRVGDKQIAGRIRQIVSPIAAQQERDAKDVLKQVLLNQGMSEGQFVETIGAEMETALLQTALTNGFAASNPSLVKDLYAAQNETRDVEMIVFLDKDVKDIPEPSEEQLLQLYEATKESYAIAETRSLQILEINDERIRKTLEISDEDIRQTYESNRDLYSLPERFTLQQALLDTQDQANQVFEKAKAGSSLEKAVQNVTGQPRAYLGEKEFTEDQIFEDLKSVITATESPKTLLDPIQSPLGWYVIYVKDIKEAGIIPFDEVKADIKKEIEENQLIDQIYALANEVDDLLAGGAPVEEVQGQVELNVKTLPTLNRFGQNDKREDALGDYEQSRTMILENGFELLEGETSPVMETADGRFIAVNVQNIQEKSYQPFEEVQKDIATKWVNDQRGFENKLRIQAHLAEMAEKDLSINQLAKDKGKRIQKYSKLKRGEGPKGPLLPQSIFNLFQAKPNVPGVVDVEGGSAIAVVKSYNFPKEVDVSSEAFQTLEQSLLQTEAQDGFIMYVNDKAQETSVSINDRLLRSLYSQQN